MSKNCKSFCVYKHIFPNNKVYIGITCQNPSFRWRRDGSGYKPRENNNSTKIWNAINKYGWNNVQHEILFENLSQEEAEKKEIELIQFYNSTDDEFGYNIAIGGGIVSFSKEVRDKISHSRKGKNYGLVGENAPMYGKHHSDESKKKISAAKKGSNNPMYGVHPTEEMKRHLREKHKDISKSVVQKDKLGNVINTFASLHLASDLTGINRSSISMCAKGEYKMAGGFIWEYEEK